MALSLYPTFLLILFVPTLVLIRLKEAEEARTLCISIENLECAGELVAALTTHSTAMTTLYRDIHALTVNNVDEMSKYEGLFSQASSYQTWFKTRKQVANTMKKAAAKQA